MVLGFVRDSRLHISYAPEMNKFIGKIYEIESICDEYDSRPSYRLKDVWDTSHSHQWIWDQDWIEPVQTIDINKDSLKALIDGGIEC